MPVNGLSPTPLQPNSLVVDLPRMTAPAARKRSTDGASRTTGAALVVRDPKRCGIPATAIRSLTEVGMPSNGPSIPPCIIRASAALACPCAPARSRWANMFSIGSITSNRRMTSTRTSVGENARRRKPSDRSAIVAKAKPDMSACPYASTIATARTGEPEPPLNLMGRPMNSNSPRPTRVSRLTSHSKCEIPRSRHRRC